jgi:hypothetical protein
MLTRLFIAASIVCTSAVVVAQSTGHTAVTHQQAVASKDKPPLKTVAPAKSPVLLSASATLSKKGSSQASISIFVSKKDGFVAANAAIRRSINGYARHKCHAGHL